MSFTAEDGKTEYIIQTATKFTNSTCPERRSRHF